jgi:arylsulfatase A-like enzyme
MRETKPMADRPNFLFFITDQQRADHLGCYGNSILQTPHIDGIAARGVAFDRFYVASPICMPNRATLMTGRMPSLNGVRHNGIPLSLRATVFTELLRSSGYRTALAGKCHLQNMLDAPPMVRRAVDSGRAPVAGLEEAEHERFDGEEYQQERTARWHDPKHDVRLPFYGFDHVELCNGHGDQTFGHYSRWLMERALDADQLRGRANAIPDDTIIVPQAWRTRLPEEFYSTSYIAERAEAFLRDHAAASPQTPFFLLCSFPDPHHPFTPPGRYWNRYDPRQIPAPPTCRPPGAEAPPHLRWLHEERSSGATNVNTPRVIAVAEREAREAIALTYGMIAMIDDAVGRILQALAAAGLRENTVVVFTADHGDLMGDHGLLFKHPLHYQGLIRVPFLWAEPGASAGFRCGELSGTRDIAATILDRAGIAGYNGLQGRSLLAEIAGQAPAARQESALIEEDGQRIFGGFSGPVRCRTLVTERWRLSLYSGAEWGELYDLDEDPDELRNLWFDHDHRAVRAEMIERLARSMMAACDSFPLPTGLA